MGGGVSIKTHQFHLIEKTLSELRRHYGRKEDDEGTDHREGDQGHQDRKMTFYAGLTPSGAS